MKEHLHTLELGDKYTYDRPVAELEIVPVTRHSLIAAVLKSPDFTTTYAERAATLGLGKRLVVWFDGVLRSANRSPASTLPRLTGRERRSCIPR
jgi:hypothetical protein